MEEGHPKREEGGGARRSIELLDNHNHTVLELQPTVAANNNRSVPSIVESHHLPTH